MMRVRAVVLAVFVSTLHLGLSTSPGYSQPLTASNIVLMARQRLVDFKATDNRQSLFDATNYFAMALAIDSNHTDAIVLGSFSRFLALSYDPDVNQFLTDFGFDPDGRNPFNWTADGPASIPATASTPWTGETITLATTKLMPQIDSALNELARIPTNWNGTLIVTTNEFPMDNDVEVDAGDVQMFQAGLETLKFVLSFLNAYNANLNLAYFEHLPTPLATIRVDGLMTDWAAVPAPQLDSQNAPSPWGNIDIRSLRTAQNASNFFILVETYTKPIRTNAMVVINLNDQPGQGYDAGEFDDLTLEVSPSNMVAWTGITNRVPYDLPGAVVRRGAVLEISIPRAALGNPAYCEATYAAVWVPAQAGDEFNLGGHRQISDFFAKYPQCFTVTNRDYLPQAAAALERAIGFYLAGSELIRGETDPQEDDLFSFGTTPEALDSEAQARDNMAKVRDSLHGPVHFDGGNFHEWMDLSRVFLPPYITRALLPRFTADNEIITGTFPDPTFNQVLPGMTQTKLTRSLTTDTMYPSGVGISSPNNRDWFVIGSTMPISAWIDGFSFDPVAKVEFFANGRKLGEVLSEPFSWNWTSVPAGIYSLTVKATDTRGKTAVSDAVSVKVIPTPPNFVISDVDLIPQDPYCGGTFSATIKVKNLGPATGNAGTLAVWANCPHPEQYIKPRDKFLSVGSLTNNQEKTFVVTGLAAATEGAKELRVKVDAANLTIESDESDNEATLSYRVLRKPDLSIVSAKILPIDPSVHGAVTAFVTVKNQGRANADAFDVAIWPNCPLPPASDAGAPVVFTVAGLTSQEVRVLSPVQVEVGTNSGIRTLRVFVDSGRDLDEEREDNNQAAIRYTPVARPDFVVTAVSFAPSDRPILGSNFAAVVTVKNIGDAAGNGQWLDAWANRSNDVLPSLSVRGNASVYGKLVSLAPGTTRNVTLTGLPAGTNGEPRVFRVLVDSRAGTREICETNNGFSVEYTPIP